MIYILIILTFVTRGTAATSVEFNSKEACMAAAESMYKQDRNEGSVRLTCVPKGEKK